MAATPERAVDAAIARGDIPRDAAVRPPRGRESAEGELPDRGRGDGGDRRSAARFLSQLVRGDLHDAPAGRRARRSPAAQQRLPAQRLSRDERAVRHAIRTTSATWTSPAASAATTTATRRRTARRSARTARRVMRSNRMPGAGCRVLGAACWVLGARCVGVRAFQVRSDWRNVGWTLRREWVCR